MSGPTRPAEPGWRGHGGIASSARWGGVFFGAYAVLAWSSFGLFGAGDIGVTFFPPAGLTFVAFLRSSRWPVLMIAFASAEVIVDLTQEISLTMALGFAAANLAEPIVSAALLRRFCPALDLLRRRDALLAALIAMGVGPVAGALIGDLTLTLGGGDAWLSSFGHWWVGDSLGVLVMAPALLILWDRPVARPPVATLEALLLVGAVAGLGVGLFAASEWPIGYLAIPLLAWTALELGGVGVAFVSPVLVALSTAATASDRGPWALSALETEHDQLLAQQTFWTAAVLGAWTLAIVLVERERAIRAIHRAQADGQVHEARAAFDRRRREDTAALAALLESLAAMTSRSQVISEVRRYAADRYEVDTVAISMFDDDGEVVTMRAGAETGTEPRRHRTASGEMLETARRNGKPWFDDDGTSIRLEEPLEWIAPPGATVRAVACVPVTVGRTQWAIVHLWTAPHDVSGGERVELAALGSLVLPAYDRALLHEQEHTIAQTLQQSLLEGRVDSVGWARLAARYLPAAEHMEIGGDWYEAVALDDERVLLMVGDTVGHGLTAAATMGRLASAARALAFEYGPGELLVRLERSASGVPSGFFATASCVLLHRTGGRIVHASAGHPSPLVRHASGEVEVLDGALGPPLSLESRQPRVEAASVMEPGSILLLYTDGLIERRGESIDEGLERLSDAVGTIFVDDLDRSVDRLLAVMLDRTERRDDVALLCAELSA